MFGFDKKTFFTGLTVLSCASLLSATQLSCISVKNQECKIRPEIININSDKPVFYLFSIKTRKCSSSSNNINDPYAKICVPDVFNFMSRTTETRDIKWHETCKYKFRLDASACYNKQRWNDGKCLCECKELIDKGVCDKGYIWNPSNCEYECDKSCDVGEYLDYENCKLADKLVEECNEIIEEVKIMKIRINAVLAYCTLCCFQ